MTLIAIAHRSSSCRRRPSFAARVARRAATFVAWSAVLASAGQVEPTSAPVRKAIDWRPDTARMLQADALYPRVVALGDARNLLLSYESRGSSYVRTSVDGGQRWGDPVQVAHNEWGTCANPQPLRLRSGRVLLFFNGRPRRAGVHPFTIEVATSDDQGATWTRARMPIFQAGTEPFTGCYEPAAVEGADGEIDLYFANEQPHAATRSQEITSLRSTDGGKTWSAPRVVSFRPGHRDGMPVPAILRDGQTLVAIEDNGWRDDPLMRATLVQDDGPPDATPVGGVDDRRWIASDALNADDVIAAAPYLVVDPDGGTTVLSCQMHSSRVPAPTMAVLIGDADGKRFGEPSHPFAAVPDVTAGSGQWWNSLYASGGGRVVALSSIHRAGRSEVWWVEGRVVPTAPP